MPPGAPPKSKFIEIHLVLCLSLRLDAYCSAETFFWRTDPHGAWGAPKCPPGGAPKSKFLEIRQVWCLSLRIDAYCSAETFFWGTDPHGARRSPPKGTQMGPHPTSTEIHHCMVSIDSSRFTTLMLYNMMIYNMENRPSWGPREPPKGTPNGTPPDFHRNTPLYGIDRFVSMHTLNLQHSSGPPGAPQMGHRRSGPIAHPCLFEESNPGALGTQYIFPTSVGIEIRLPRDL